LGQDAGPAKPSYCDRWKAKPPTTPAGLGTDSECVDFEKEPTNDAPCLGASNATAVIAKVAVAQTHLLEPGTAHYEQRDDGATLVPVADDVGLMPKFRLVSHRPALLKVDVTGSGPSPDVKVTAERNGQALGSMCLKGPSALPASAPATPSLADSFTVSMPAAWMRPGLSLTIEAGPIKKAIAAESLSIGAGLRHHVVELSYLMWGNSTPKNVRRFTREMAADIPVQSLVWSSFPTPVRVDPVIISPGKVQSTPGGGFDAIDVAIATAASIQQANGMSDESKFFGVLDTDQGGGLGGGDAAGGDATTGIMHHELGHTYGLAHLGDWYAQKKYPFAGGTESVGGSVGPIWAYDQFAREFFSPWLPKMPNLLRQDPMQSGDGQQDPARTVMFFGAFSVQVITEHFQSRVYWDDERNGYATWNAKTGEFELVEPPNDGYLGVAQRDVPVYTVFGSYARDGGGSIIPEATVIQPILHYSGNLTKLIDITNPVDVAWLKKNPNALCYWGCDYTVRLTFADGTSRVATLQQDTKPDQFVRWAVNFPTMDVKPTKAELLYRPLSAQSGSGSQNHPSKLDASTSLATSTVLASKDF
jgi:hypothetical protein